MKIAILLFPGTNRANDIAKCLHSFTNATIDFIAPDATCLNGYNLVILPGGFSYGDANGYGAIAAKMPVIKALKNIALKNIPILGICNGFQILTASNMLPGKLLPNKQKRFISRLVELKITNHDTIFTKLYDNKIIKLPVAHYAGCYYAEETILKKLEDNNQIIMQYNEEINGSSNKIAAICNKQKNILGLMPHPENYYASYQGGTYGAALFNSLLNFIM